MDGEDYVKLTTPLKHKHKDVMAETLTDSISRNNGGSTLVGNFTIGDRITVSQDNFPIYEFTSPIISPQNPEEITYPLYG